MTPEELIEAFDTVAEAPEGITRLRELVLQLAVRGRLVPQDPEDEPASELLDRISEERLRAIEAGESPRLRQSADLASTATAEFDLPDGWTWALLDRLCYYIQRGRSPKYDDSSPVRVVSQKCVQWGGFDPSRTRGLEPSALDSYGPERFLREGDLLWNSTGTGTVGRVNTYPGSRQDELVVADSHVTVVRTALMEPSYLWCWIAGPAVQRRIEDMTTGTTKQQELGTATVRSLSVPVPPLAEQARIVARVDELMCLLDQLEAARNAREATRSAARDAALAALRDADTQEEVEVAWDRVAERMDDLFTAPTDVEPLRQTVLQLAVRGRLVPQDPEDEPASELLDRISEERLRAIEAGESPRLRQSADLASTATAEFDLPDGWTWALLDRLCYYIQRGRSPKYDDSSPARVVSQKCVQWSGFDPSKARGLDRGALDAYGPERFLRGGDLLWNSTGTGTVGRINVYSGPEHDEHVVADSHVTVVRPALIESRYLWFWIAGPVVQRRIEQMTTGTTKQQELATATVRSVSVPVPPLPEQQRILARVDELMGLIERLEGHLMEMTAAQDEFASAAVHNLEASQGASP